MDRVPSRSPLGELALEVASVFSSHCLALAALISASSLAPAQTREWTLQVGTASLDIFRGAARDGAGGLFACGYSYGALGGTNAGGGDVVVARFNAAGASLWTRQLGTSANEFAFAAADDGAGGAFAAGTTAGALGGAHAGLDDAFVVHYSASGALLWTRQLGTTQQELALAAASDGLGGVFVGGSTRGALPGEVHVGAEDAWVARLDSAGNTLWIWQQGGFGDDVVRSLASDGAGGVFVAGSSASSVFGASAGGHDGWIARLDAAGNLQWSKQFGGAAFDSFEGLSADGVGGAVAVGQTYNSLAAPTAGQADAWIVSVDGAGALRWSRQFGSTQLDVTTSASVGLLGGVFVGGKTRAGLSGAHAGGWDSWTAYYDVSGTRLWIEQFGASGDDETTALCSDDAGGAFAVGLASGPLGGTHAGWFDGWAARYRTACAEVATFCTSGTTSSGCAASLSASGVASASSAGNLTLSASNVEGARAGLFFYGLDNSGFTPTPWGGGSSSWLCVKPPTQRTPAQNSGGNAGQCDGALTLEWSSFVAAHPTSLGAPFAAGDEVFAQAWFRDPPAPKSTSLSNGVSWRVCP